MSKGQSPEVIGNMTFKEANLAVAKHYKRTYGFVRDVLDAVFGGKDEKTVDFGELDATDGGGNHLPVVDEGDVIDEPFPEGLEVVRLEDENV